MDNKKKNQQIIEETGEKYNTIIFDEDIIPKDVYCYQIELRNEKIKKLLNNQRFDYILDLGCGTGFHQKTLNEYANNLIGVDMSCGALKECKKQFHYGDYVVCDINYLPFKEKSLDCIWIAGVLHHVPNDLVNAIKHNISYSLKQEGILLIDEPNKRNPLNYLILKLSKADPTGDERPLSLFNVKEILNDSNLRIIKTDFYEFFAPFGLLIKNNSIIHICKSIDFYLQKSWIKSILIRWVIYAKKE